MATLKRDLPHPKKQKHRQHNKFDEHKHNAPVNHEHNQVTTGTFVPVGHQARWILRSAMNSYKSPLQSARAANLIEASLRKVNSSKVHATIGDIRRIAAPNLAAGNMHATSCIPVCGKLLHSGNAFPRGIDMWIECVVSNVGMMEGESAFKQRAALLRHRKALDVGNFGPIHQKFEQGAIGLARFYAVDGEHLPSEADLEHVEPESVPMLGPLQATINRARTQPAYKTVLRNCSDDASFFLSTLCFGETVLWESSQLLSSRRFVLDGISQEATNILVAAMVLVALPQVAAAVVSKLETRVMPPSEFARNLGQLKTWVPPGMFSKLAFAPAPAPKLTRNGLEIKGTAVDHIARFVPRDSYHAMIGGDAENHQTKLSRELGEETELMREQLVAEFAHFGVQLLDTDDLYHELTKLESNHVIGPHLPPRLRTQVEQFVHMCEGSVLENRWPGIWFHAHATIEKKPWLRAKVSTRFPPGKSDPEDAFGVLLRPVPRVVLKQPKSRKDKEIDAIAEAFAGVSHHEKNSSAQFARQLAVRARHKLAQERLAGLAPHIRDSIPPVIDPNFLPPSAGEDLPVERKPIPSRDRPHAYRYLRSSDVHVCKHDSEKVSFQPLVRNPGAVGESCRIVPLGELASVDATAVVMPVHHAANPCVRHGLVNSWPSHSVLANPSSPAIHKSPTGALFIDVEAARAATDSCKLRQVFRLQRLTTGKKHKRIQIRYAHVRKKQVAKPLSQFVRADAVKKEPQRAQPTQTPLQAQLAGQTSRAAVPHHNKQADPTKMSWFDQLLAPLESHQPTSTMSAKGMNEGIQYEQKQAINEDPILLIDESGCNACGGCSEWFTATPSGSMVMEVESFTNVDPTIMLQSMVAIASNVMDEAHKVTRITSITEEKQLAKDLQALGKHEFRRNKVKDIEDLFAFKSKRKPTHECVRMAATAEWVEQSKR